jgi:N-acetylmuramoyl-L-alanine amidase
MIATVLISAGHSDTDPGAVSGIFKEATLAMKLRDRVAHALKDKGVPCLKDGADGVNDTLSRAISLCNKVGGLAVEIHFNAGPPTATGIEALCKPGQKKFAQDLCIAIASITGIKLRGDKGWKADDSGQHHRLGFCEAGGVILEVCFITSAYDMSAYVTKKEAVAEAIAHVLALHAGWKDTGSLA